MTRFAVSLNMQQQRLAAAGLALALAFGAAATVYSFVAAQIEHHRHVALLARELAAQRALLAQSGEWRARLSSIKASPQWQRLFVPDKRDNQNGPVSQLVKRHGATVGRNQSKRFDTGTTIERDEQVGFSADITTLSQILYEMRASAPLFVIRKLEIHDTEPPGAAPRKAPNALQVELSVAEFAGPR